MKKSSFFRVCFLAFGLLVGLSAKAQSTYNELVQLTVNENVTTVITAT